MDQQLPAYFQDRVRANAPDGSYRPPTGPTVLPHRDYPADLPPFASPRMEAAADAHEAAARPDTPDEAAIVEHMRESGTLPSWVMETEPPPMSPPPLKARRTLPCGVVLWAERSSGGYFYHGITLPGISHKAGFDFDSALRDLPAEILAVLSAAIADLRRIVGITT